MKKLVFLIVLTCIFGMLQSQTKYLCKNGFIGFYSKTPMEEIKGDNNQATGIIDTQSGQVIINALMKSFKFDRALMEEHFNENYVESDKFPKTSFKGTITNIKSVDFKKDGTYTADIEGEMTLHGVVKSMKTKGTIEIKGDGITASGKFFLNPVDYGIVIPSVVREKIADNLEISINMVFKPMNQ